MPTPGRPAIPRPASASARPKILKGTRDSVLAEFNHRCAICGKDNPQIHHIDENRANNDASNLLPLCANCHLTDQHNPTRMHDPGKLRLFRIYKDPGILKPQFQPIYERFRFLLKPVEELSFGQIYGGVSELWNFIIELSMGNYYGTRLREFLGTPPSATHTNTSDFAENERRAAQAIREREKEYQKRVATFREEIIRLLIEQIRYQNWP